MAKFSVAKGLNKHRCEWYSYYVWLQDILHLWIIGRVNILSALCSCPWRGFITTHIVESLHWWPFWFRQKSPAFFSQQLLKRKIFSRVLKNISAIMQWWAYWYLAEILWSSTQLKCSVFKRCVDWKQISKSYKFHLFEVYKKFECQVACVTVLYKMMIYLSWLLINRPIRLLVTIVFRELLWNTNYANRNQWRFFEIKFGSLLNYPDLKISANLGCTMLRLESLLTKLNVNLKNASLPTFSKKELTAVTANCTVLSDH